MEQVGATDFEKRHEIIKSQKDLIQQGLYGGLPEEDIFKSKGDLGTSSENDIEKAKKGEGSRGGKIIGHTKTGKPIYDVNSHHAHVQFSKQDHLDAKQAHIDKMDEHGNTYWTARSDEKRKEHEESINYHRYHAMSHHNDALNHDKHIIGKTKSGKEVFGNRKAGDNDGFTADDHKNAAKLQEKNGNPYDAHIHESMASFLEKEAEKNKVIGKTNSGKDVHAGKHPREYKDFTPDEHKEASSIHDEKGNPYLSKQHTNQAKNKEEKNKESNDSDPLKDFKEIINNSKDFDEAFKKVKNIKGVPAETANHFSEKYNPDDKLSMEQSFKKLFDEVKDDGKPSLGNGKIGKDTMKNSKADSKEDEAFNKFKDNTRKHFEGGDKKESGLTIKVGTGVFDGKEFWRVTSKEHNDIGVFPKDKFSEEQAKEGYNNKYGKKDIKKSDGDFDILKSAFDELLGL